MCIGCSPGFLHDRTPHTRTPQKKVSNRLASTSQGVPSVNLAPSDRSIASPIHRRRLSSHSFPDALARAHRFPLMWAQTPAFNTVRRLDDPLTSSGVQVHPREVGAAVSTSVLGADMSVWFDIAQHGIASSFERAGLTTTRWPGGKAADRYHWKRNHYSKGICGSSLGNSPNANSTFDNFMRDVAIPAHLDVAITVNYGSNRKCTGGADPDEAADWVAYANVRKGYNLTWWTVGNEQYRAGRTRLAFETARSYPVRPGR